MARYWKSLGLSALLLPWIAAGCGLGRWDVQPPRREPIGMAPLPPIHETINGGEAAAEPSGDRAATAGEPTPKSRIRRAPWARDPETVAANGRPSPTAPSPPEPQNGEPPAFPIGTPPGAEPDPLPAPDPIPAPPEIPNEPAQAPAPTPTAERPGDPSLGPAPDAVPNIEIPPVPATEPVPSPEPAPTVPDNGDPQSQPPPPPIPDRPPAGDPSMGPAPDAVPNLEPPTPTPAPTAPAPEPSTAPADVPAPVEVPAIPASEVPPDGLPTLPPTEAPAPAEVPAPVEVPTIPEPSAPPPGLPTLPPVEPTPTPTSEPPPSTAQNAKVDPAVQQASASSDRSMPPGAEWKVAPGKAASETAARIGDEIITLSELRTAVREQIRGMNLPKDQPISEADKNAVASLMLDRMIDRVILVQEAKRKIKDEKKWKQFLETLERVWRERELPDLIRQHGVADEYALKQKLENENLSLPDKRAAFIQNLMAREYLMGQVKDRIKVYAPAMREYYEEHRSDFDRPAQVRWREVAVEVGRHADRAEARRKAEAALARLRRGESFAKVAQAESEGPTASTGGLWETSPEGYNVPAVRDALGNQPPNQVSGILEGPSSFHVVLVESRRAAGPARFDEVQDEVRKILLEKKESDEMNAYLDTVRGRYVVTTMFDGSASAPGAGRKAMASATGRRGR